ncbi:EF-P lysine aminoacylase EpmA [Deltaproteobacteria bacterium TL4]
MQSRRSPYRTHDSSPGRLTQPPVPGRYAGRVLEIEKGTPSRWVILMEDTSQVFSVPDPEDIPCGTLIGFHVDAQGCLRDVEVFNIPDLSFKGTGDTLRWCRKHNQKTRMTLIRQRHLILQELRAWFNQQGFLEVNTPLLVRAPAPEAQLFPFQTESGFLVTSPEFQMKRMLVGGFEKIYQIASCFRDHEVGTYHNPEFTMLEWYRAYDHLSSIVADVESFVYSIVTRLSLSCVRQLEDQAVALVLEPPWPRKTVAEVLWQYLKIELKAQTSLESLKNQAVAQGYQKCLDGAKTYEEVFFRLWDEIQSKLGIPNPLWVYDWPEMLPSLAQPRRDGRGVVERTELYIAGIELANGYGELTDPEKQRERFEQAIQHRTIQNRPKVPLDENFLSSLQEGLPPCSGMAMGVDRLLMLLTGARHIREVLCFSWDEV